MNANGPPDRPPVFTKAEETALRDLSISAGCATGDLDGEPRLSPDGVRSVLAMCQADGGDPAKVYRHFLATSSFVRRGLAPAIPIESVLPTAADVEETRRQRARRPAKRRRRQDGRPK